MPVRPATLNCFAAADEIDTLLHARPNSPEADRLDELLALNAEYEGLRAETDTPDPVEIIERTLMERGLGIGDLAPMIGSVAKARAVLARERPLTLPMIWRLHKRLAIPGALLLPAIAPEARVS